MRGWIKCSLGFGLLWMPGSMQACPPCYSNFFRQVAKRDSAEPPQENDFLNAQGLCGGFAEYLLILAASDAVPFSEKRKMVEVIERCAQSRAFVNYGVCSLGEYLPWSQYRKCSVIISACCLPVIISQSLSRLSLSPDARPMAPLPLSARFSGPLVAETG